MREEIEETKKRGCGKYIAIGCAGVLLLSIIGAFFAYQGVKGVISGVADQYTDTAPLELPSVEVTEEEAAAVLERVAKFTEALQQDKQPSALVLTSQDINVLIQRHPDWTEMADKVYVTLEEDKIQGQVSFPLDDIGSLFKGRYLNGSATFRLSMTAGRLLVFIDSAQVGEESIPEEFMSAIRVKNLAEEANKGPDMKAILQKLDSITVQDGKLSIVPKLIQSELPE